MLIISCHADTGFSRHKLCRRGPGLVHGHLDNFAGVYAVMSAYFSGRMNTDSVRIELTEGEEANSAGAHRVMNSLSPNDTVIVVDVTGTETERDFTIEKCKDNSLSQFLIQALKGLKFDLFKNCPDPIADEDEVDAYLELCAKVCFLGIPCFGGDYNDGPVSCHLRSIKSASEALCRIAQAYEILHKPRSGKLLTKGAKASTNVSSL